MDLEKAYDKVNRKALWQVLRIELCWVELRVCMFIVPLVSE